MTTTITNSVMYNIPINMFRHGNTYLLFCFPPFMTPQKGNKLNDMATTNSNNSHKMNCKMEKKVNEHRIYQMNSKSTIYHFKYQKTKKKIIQFALLKIENGGKDICKYEYINNLCVCVL